MTRSSQLTRLILAAVLIVLLCWACTPPPRTYVADITYQKHLFSVRDLQATSLLILPVFTKTGMDTSADLSPARQGDWLFRNRGDIVFATVERGDFERSVISRYGPIVLSGFYMSLRTGSVVATQTNDSLWDLIPARFLAVSRITEGARIHAFSGETKTRLVLEFEIWDVYAGEVVWRTQVSASTFDQDISDRTFVWEALCRAWQTLPVTGPANNEEVW